MFNYLANVLNEKTVKYNIFLLLLCINSKLVKLCIISFIAFKGKHRMITSKIQSIKVFLKFF